jgi:uncharacterized membrane protein YedE/YeeE
VACIEEEGVVAGKPWMVVVFWFLAGMSVSGVSSLFAWPTLIANPYTTTDERIVSIGERIVCIGLMTLHWAALVGVTVLGWRLYAR